MQGARRDGQVFEVQEGSPVRLKVFAAKGAGRIGGTVSHGEQPLSGALVILAPAAASPRPEDYRAFQSDGDGSYEFTALPPGEYLVFAVADGADLEYANPTAVQPFLKFAEKLRVEPGGSYNKRLQPVAPQP